MFRDGILLMEVIYIARVRNLTSTRKQCYDGSKTRRPYMIVKREGNGYLMELQNTWKWKKSYMKISKSYANVG